MLTEASKILKDNGWTIGWGPDFFEALKKGSSVSFRLSEDQQCIIASNFDGSKSSEPGDVREFLETIGLVKQVKPTCQ